MEQLNELFKSEEFKVIKITVTRNSETFNFVFALEDPIPYQKIKIMEQATLNSIRNRPRFKFSTKLSPVEYEQHLLEMIRANPLIHGKINREVASIWVNNNIDNYWKPYLAIRIEKAANRKTILR